MTDYVTCRACGAEVGRMGIGTHAGMHKRAYRKEHGTVPADYDVVVEWVRKGRITEDSTTLEDFGAVNLATNP